MLWNIAINDAGAEYDPLTLLRTRTMFGRPDWMTIYGQMRQAIEGGQYLHGSTSQLKTKVGTYFCGAGPIAKALKDECPYLVFYQVHQSSGYLTSLLHNFLHKAHQENTSSINRFRSEFQIHELNREGIYDKGD